ncbi:MAG: SMP-30/gluconolactonase/LRE family protein [Dehalococcoidia bacterium]
MKSEVEMLAAENAVVGEGPLWDPDAQKLYWTDIRTGRFFEFDPPTNKNRLIHRGVFVGGASVNKQGGFTFGTWEGVMLWRSDQDWKWLHHDPERGGTMQFNDVTAGPDGSFYAGSFYEDRPGKLFRFFPDGAVEVLAEGVGVSNGMGFSPDLRTFYHTDTRARTIYAYDYDPSTHRQSNRRTFVTLPNTEGAPDGMTVDSEGFIWSATWGGSSVIRFDPDGKEERRIQFPATQTSSVMFGGSDLTDLYVTSANSGAGKSPGDREHRGGELYRVKQEIQGKPEFKTDIPWPE